MPTPTENVVSCIISSDIAVFDATYRRLLRHWLGQLTVQVYWCNTGVVNGLDAR